MLLKFLHQSTDNNYILIVWINTVFHEKKNKIFVQIFFVGKMVYYSLMIIEKKRTEIFMTDFLLEK